MLLEKVIKFVTNLGYVILDFFYFTFRLFSLATAKIKSSKHLTFKPFLKKQHRKQLELGIIIKSEIISFKHLLIEVIRPLLKIFKSIVYSPAFLIKNIFLYVKKIRLFIFGVFFTILFIFIPYLVYSWFRELPNPEMISVTPKYGSSQILDRNGVLLYEIYSDRKYSPVKLDQIPRDVIDATISVEDSEFYVHSGLRVDSIIRALNQTILQRNTQGGSTITQQLVKTVLLTPERTLSRKIKEAILSLLVETKYSKDQILEMYLNNVSYGGNAWGIESASKKYFGKDVWELDLAEAALLAGLTSAPSSYSPIQNFDLAKERQKYVLTRMRDLGYITDRESTDAAAEEIKIVAQDSYIRAPHFVNFIISQLSKKFGERYVEQGGLKIVTTLDISIQENIQEIVRQEVEKGRIYNFTNGAAVVIDPKTSQIISYVGSLDYFKDGFGAFDVVTAFRQPGSSIKPVTYALALSLGFTPASTIEDTPITYTSVGSPPYSPVNYDGKFHGIVTLRSALANSFNIPAVKLAKIVGPDNIVSLGRDMGLKDWNVDGSYGLAVTLGGKEVRLLDLTNVYATFARKGYYEDLEGVLTITDGRGFEIYKSTPQNRQQVISEEVSYVIYDILSDNTARSLEFGSNSSLVVPGYKVAAKTGTTDQIKDNWTFGFTPSYVVGVWVGNNNNTPMNRNQASGITGAAPIWNKIMIGLLKDKPNEVFRMPAGVFVKANPECKKSEIFIKGSNVPKSLCPAEKKDEEKK